jgi:hypothetical protein
MSDLPPLKIAYISRRPFTDGPVTTTFPENDPANIAYVLAGDYYSFFTLKKLSHEQLREKLAPYHLVFVPIDLRALETVAHIAFACEDRLVTYSEGNIADYQMHSPTGQTTFLQIINRAKINFIYWEKYAPFYRSLTERPVQYLPYPYFAEEAVPFTVPINQRERHITLPSGLAGNTRNGLGSLAVARPLLREGCVEQINCWLAAVNFSEDAQAVQHFLFGTPLPRRRSGFNWRQWLQQSGVDYRFLLNVKQRWGQKQDIAPPPPLVQANGLALYRRRTWLHYIPELAKTMLVVDMNNRETVGRNALDCAAVCVPCISTNRSDMQERLFPDITISDSWDVEEASLLCRHLLQDEHFYRSTIERAAVELAQFGPEGFKQRFAAILTEQPALLSPE